MIDTGFDNLLNALSEYKNAVAVHYKDRLVADDKKATGQLINSISTEIKVGSDTFEVVLNVVDYFKYVENGRKPGKFPPVDKILSWIRVKPVIPRPINGKLPTEQQLAFLIGRKIATEGIEAGHQLKDTVEAINAEYIPRLEQALQEDFDAYAIKVYDKIGSLTLF